MGADSGSPHPPSKAVCMDEVGGETGADLKVLLLVCIGAASVGAGGAAGFDAGSGSGVAQASFEPHASRLLRLEKLVDEADVCAGATGVGLGGWIGWERLKARLLV